MDLKNKIQKRSEEIHGEIVEIRRHLHAHPELSFEEHKTAAYVSDKLTSWGITHETGVADTGLIGTIKGKNPDSRIIALRGDMDALPIQEISNKPYKSVHDGIMHACGHDVHTSCLLGAGKILNDLRQEWEGTVQLIFQPGEERVPGGASLMIKDGIFDKVKPRSIFGQHVYPELPAGKVGIKGGLYMASADELYFTIHGKGGHGAMPHNTIDPIVIASHLVLALQQIVSRNAASVTPSVLTIGRFEGLGASNVIPDKVSLMGTFRTFDEKWRDEAHQLIERTAHGICESMGARLELEIRKGYPSLHNNEKLSSRFRELACDYLGSENVIDLDYRMTAEDFSYFAQLIPGCFYRLGTASIDGSNSKAVHTPGFDIDEQAIKIGCGLMAWSAVND